MKIEPFAPKLLIDYGYFCRMFGPLAFAEFVPLWHAADALTQAAIEGGFEPHDVPDLAVGDTKSTGSISEDRALTLVCRGLFAFFFCSVHSPPITQLHAP